MADLSTNIEQSAQAPAKVSGDAGAVEQHSLQDQIAADKYLASKAAQNATGIGGIKFVKLMASGA